MTNQEVKNMCERMEIIFDKDHPDHISVNKQKMLSPPFMEYVLTDRPVFADGKRYIDIKSLSIRIYSDTEVLEKEEKVQEVLETEDIRWKRSSEYLDELLLWVIIYNMEV